MVVFADDDEKVTDEMLIKRNYESFLYTFRDVEKILKKHYKHLDVVLRSRKNSVGLHGDGFHYFNTRVLIRDNDSANPFNDSNEKLANFSISCFPNCCGMAILTANYESYAIPYEGKLMNNLNFSLGLALNTTLNYGYKAVILTVKYNEEELIKTLENLGFKKVFTSLRRSSSGELYTFMGNYDLLVKSKDILYNELNKLENVSEKKEVSTSVEI